MIEKLKEIKAFQSSICQKIERSTIADDIKNVLDKETPIIFELKHLLQGRSQQKQKFNFSCLTFHFFDKCLPFYL